MKTGIVSIIIVILLSFSSFLLGDTVIISADQWCPYNCVPDSEQPGFMVETATMIFNRAGHQVKYFIRPWKRAQKEVMEGTIQGLIASTPQNSIGLNLVYPEIEQARMNNCFFTLNDSNWKYEGLESLKTVKLGIIQGYHYGPEIQFYIDNTISNQVMIQDIAGENALERNIKKLNKYRITAVLADRSVFLFTANHLGILDKLRFAGNDGTSPEFNNLYIAFTPNSVSNKSNHYAALLSAGMNQLRSSGELSKILKKYQLLDWR
jgi:polar amino acid transport system substrate-binding protein